MGADWKNGVNHGLRRVGYEMVRSRRRGPSGRLSPPARASGGRLLTAPVFLFSSVRSGSTLLRMILDSHSRLHAPHELHLHDLKVDLSTDYVASSMAELGLPQRELEHLLWDRILYQALVSSGKEVLVNKSPDDLFMWRRIAGCWRDARFIFLLRSPGAVVDSWRRARPHYSEDDAIDSVLKYMGPLEEARGALPGPTVRYEELVSEPERVVQGLCDSLGIEWEPQMLEYGRIEGRTFKAGLGDWSNRIRSGRIQEREVATMEIPLRLSKVAKSWGYL